MSITADVVGVPELNRVFETLRKAQANKITGPAIRKAASIGAKKVKAAIPSRYKDVRKAIGWRSLKTRYNGGLVGAKVGAAVGKRKEAKERPARTRPGVGMGTRNVHWWFLGTDDRQTGQKTSRAGRAKAGQKQEYKIESTGGVVRRTGRMPKQEDSVSAIIGRNGGEINTVIRDGVQKGLEKEVARIASKRAI